MKLEKLRCPNCNGNLEINVEDKEYIFCPYCGEKFHIDDMKNEFTINKNVNIKKEVKKTKRTVNEAEIIRAKNEANETKYGLILLIVLIFILFSINGIIFIGDKLNEREIKKAIDAGKICAGSSDDYKGENYEVVIEQLETLGFTNISSVDLDDSGVFFWRNDKVESISISGDTSFYTDDYFNPDDAIIVKYH